MRICSGFYNKALENQEAVLNAGERECTDMETYVPLRV